MVELAAVLCVHKQPPRRVQHVDPLARLLLDCQQLLRLLLLLLEHAIGLRLQARLLLLRKRLFRLLLLQEAWLFRLLLLLLC